MHFMLSYLLVAFSLFTIGWCQILGYCSSTSPVNACKPCDGEDFCGNSLTGVYYCFPTRDEACYTQSYAGYCTLRSNKNKCRGCNNELDCGNEYGVAFYCMQTLEPICQNISFQVAFRLDGIQDNYFHDVYQTLLSTFSDKKQKLDASVISSKLNDDDLLIETMINLSNLKLLEIISNGYEFRDYTNLTYDQQIEDLQNANQAIYDLFYVQNDVFVPPYHR